MESGEKNRITQSLHIQIVVSTGIGLLLAMAIFLRREKKKEGPKEGSRLRDGEKTFLFIVIVGPLDVNEN